MWSSRRTRKLAVALALTIWSHTIASRAIGASAVHARHPNVVIIVLDDVGFGETSTFGGPANTPALDRLARRGLRYNNFNTTGLCSPTRAALLSGRNHHRMGFGTVGERPEPGYDGVWKPSMASIAQVLRDNGYRTAALGKWHNTPSWELTQDGPFDRWPTGLGFDTFYGNLIGMSSQWEPALWRDTMPVSPPRTPSQGYHLTEDLVDEAIRWIDADARASNAPPYFLYFATGASHTPHHVPRAWIDRYRGRFDGGWDVERAAIYARQKALGVIPRDARLTPRPAELPAWKELSDVQRKLYALQMEVYAAFVEHTDFHVGRLLAAIERRDDAQDTLIFYVVGDNGTESAIGIDGAENIVATATGNARSLPEQLAHADELGGPSHTNIYSAGWAWAGSTPFKWTKHVASHFGGVRNPLLVSWPRRIRHAGELRSTFTHVTDIVPTIYDAIGIEPPIEVRGTAQLPFDGQSFAWSFDDADLRSTRRPQYFEIEGNRAVYSDGWLAAARNTIPWIQRPWAVPAVRDDDDRWELYHVASDFSEAHDLAQRYPRKLRALRTLFDTEARANLVQPLGVSVGSIPRGQPAEKRRFTFRADRPTTPLAARTTPDLSQPFRLEADVDASDSGTEGVLLSAGGRGGGIALFIQSGELILENNFLGVAQDILRTPLPRGPLAIVYEQERYSLGTAAMSAKLSINGIVAAEGVFKRVAPPDPLDNFDVGQDSGEPVSRSYYAPFRFTGHIARLVVLQK